MMNNFKKLSNAAGSVIAPYQFAEAVNKDAQGFMEVCQVLRIFSQNIPDVFESYMQDGRDHRFDVSVDPVAESSEIVNQAYKKSFPPKSGKNAKSLDERMWEFFNKFEESYAMFDPQQNHLFEKYEVDKLFTEATPYRSISENVLDALDASKQHPNIAFIARLASKSHEYNL